MAPSNGSSEMCFTQDSCQFILPSATYTRYLLEAEKTFDECGAFLWLANHWKINYFFIGVYLLAIFAGRRLMRARAPFLLRGALLLWNLSLAVFSIFAAWRTVTAVLYHVGQVGFHATVCGGNTKQYHQSVAMYMWYFAFSKFLELGDTAFIVLRKTPLLFLHWFHHATVCFFVWSCNAYPSNIHICFMTMNYFVHSFMYSYYALKVLRVRVPKPVSMAITSMQVFQMFVGVYISLYAYHMKATPGVGCCVPDEALTIALSIYFSYLVLFLNFFVRVYVLNKPLEALAKKSD